MVMTGKDVKGVFAGGLVCGGKCIATILSRRTGVWVCDEPQVSHDDSSGFRLQRPESCVHPGIREKFVVSSALDDSSVVHDNDLIGIDDR
jgi:hypothetical protein